MFKVDIMIVIWKYCGDWLEHTVTVLQQHLFDTTSELSCSKYENFKLKEEHNLKTTQVAALETEIEKLKVVVHNKGPR